MASLCLVAKASLALAGALALSGRLASMVALAHSSLAQSSLSGATSGPAPPGLARYSSPPIPSRTAEALAWLRALR